MVHTIERIFEREMVILGLAMHVHAIDSKCEQKSHSFQAWTSSDLESFRSPQAALDFHV